MTNLAFLGFLKDQLGNYTVAFVCAGIPPLVGALLMCFIYKVKYTKPSDAMLEENNVQDQILEHNAVNNPIIKCRRSQDNLQNDTKTIGSKNSINLNMYSDLKEVMHPESVQSEKCTSSISCNKDDKCANVPENESLIKK